MYADLKKEKIKSEENFKKEIDQLKKHNTDLESEVFVATKDNKNKDEEKKTLLKIFEGMNVLLAKQNLPSMEKGETQEKSRDEQIYLCDKCDVTSTNITDFNLHEIRKHSQNTKFKCETCSKEFQDNSSLKEHKKTHTTKLKCDYCQYRADSKPELNTHFLKRHSKQYECDWCDHVSHTKDNIEHHERVDHKITKTRGKYSCDDCEKVFLTSNDKVRYVEITHYKTQENRGFLKRSLSYEERKRNGFCRFWNNSECFYGYQCKFLHEEAPYCRFQEQCKEKQRCRFYHEKHSHSISSSNHPASVSPSFLGFPPGQAKWKGRLHNQHY